MKLDQVPKKNPFNAPEGYFDRLPGIVQSRIEAERPVSQSQIYFRFGLRYALPMLVLVAAGIFWFQSENSGTVKFETELAAIDAQNLAIYLEQLDINADDLIETVDPIAIGWSPEDLKALENSIYESYGLSDADVSGLLNVLEVESVNDSVQ